MRDLRGYIITPFIIIAAIGFSFLLSVRGFSFLISKRFLDIIAL